MKNSILDSLQALNSSDYYPFHMPGHKRMTMEGIAVTGLDITEIDDFDNLYMPEGILKNAKERAAALYTSKETFFGVNGSTGNLLTAISAAFSPGDIVLVARNCHRSVYHAIELRGLIPIFVYPSTENRYDLCLGITLKQVKDAIERFEDSYKKPFRIAGMILTSPTYEGMISQIAEIADFLHERGSVLIVDEAHGAHFGFHPDFPESAVKLGADIVVQSLHKTLPALTQTSLLHLCSDRVQKEQVMKYLRMYQTSSPSYVLMMSIDECIRLLESRSEELFDAYAKRLSAFYEEMKDNVVIKVVPQDGQDIGKIIIGDAPCISAHEIYKTLRERFHLQPEMSGLHHVLMMTSVFDTDEGFKRLKEALKALDLQCAQRNVTQKDSGTTMLSAEASVLYTKAPERIKLPGEIFPKTCKKVKLKDAAGCVSAEYIYLYPPGIPFLIPGEKLPQYMPAILLNLQEAGYRLDGLLFDDEIMVLSED